LVSHKATIHGRVASASTANAGFPATVFILQDEAAWRAILGGLRSELDLSISTWGPEEPPRALDVKQALELTTKIFALRQELPTKVKIGETDEFSEFSVPVTFDDKTENIVVLVIGKSDSNTAIWRESFEVNDGQELNFTVDGQVFTIADPNNQITSFIEKRTGTQEGERTNSRQEASAPQEARPTSLDALVIDISSIVRQIYRSPLALPLIVAMLWVTYRDKLDTIHALLLLLWSLALGYLIVWIWPQTFVLFSQQNAAIQTSNVPERQLTGKAATVALFAYLRMMERDDGKWAPRTMRFILLLSSIFSLAYSLMWVLIFISRKFDFDQNTLNSIPVFSAATAMMLIVLALYTAASVKAHSSSLSTSVLILNVCCPLLLLGGSILAFMLLKGWQVVLWLVFLIVAYPPVLALTRADLIADRKLRTFYLVGLRQLRLMLTHLPDTNAKTPDERQASKATPSKSAK
jgi:hypothetical protein